MSAVGIVTITLGVLVVCGRVTLLVAPAATLCWFKETIASNGRLRTLGAFFVTLGVAMAWAGASEDSGLATFLTVFGWGFLGNLRTGAGAVPGHLPRHRQPVLALRHKGESVLVALPRAGRHRGRGAHGLLRRTCALTSWSQR